MPILRIKRTYDFTDSRKDYEIYIDGNMIGTIGTGETRQFEISEGEHFLNSKLNWVKSHSFSFGIKNKETKTFMVGRSKMVKLIINIFMIIAVLSFILTFFKIFNFAVYLNIPVILFLFYYYTFGRYKFLSFYEL